MRKDVNSGPLARSTVHLLHRADQCAGDIFHSFATLQGLTPRQFAVLLIVSENEGLSQTDLVAATGIDRSTLADVVRRMLQKGLLQRRRMKQDARAYEITLTDYGREMLATAQPVADRLDERILSVLSPDDRHNFLTALNTIVESMSGGNANTGRQ